MILTVIGCAGAALCEARRAYDAPIILATPGLRLIA